VKIDVKLLADFLQKAEQFSFTVMEHKGVHVVRSILQKEVNLKLTSRSDRYSLNVFVHDAPRFQEIVHETEPSALLTIVPPPVAG